MAREWGGWWHLNDENLYEKCYSKTAESCRNPGRTQKPDYTRIAPDKRKSGGFNKHNVPSAQRKKSTGGSAQGNKKASPGLVRKIEGDWHVPGDFNSSFKNFNGGKTMGSKPVSGGTAPENLKKSFDSFSKKHGFNMNVPKNSVLANAGFTREDEERFNRTGQTKKVLDGVAFLSKQSDSKFGDNDVYKKRLLKDFGEMVKANNYKVDVKTMSPILEKQYKEYAVLSRSNISNDKVLDLLEKNAAEKITFFNKLQALEASKSKMSNSDYYGLVTELNSVKSKSFAQSDTEFASRVKQLEEKKRKADKRNASYSRSTQSSPKKSSGGFFSRFRRKTR